MMFDDAALTESKKYEHKFLINIQHASLKKNLTEFLFYSNGSLK